MVDVDDPIASEGDLVVDVRGAAFNPLDFKVSSGLIPMMTGPDFPKGFGTDLAGVVVQVALGGRWVRGR